VPKRELAAAYGLSYEQPGRLKFLPSPYAGDLKAKYDRPRDAFPSLLCFALHYCVYTPRNNYFVRAEVVTGAKYQRTSATKNGSLRAFSVRQRSFSYTGIVLQVDRKAPGSL
jgi:hypothetical protein